jgi:hypothetical protein
MLQSSFPGLGTTPTNELGQTASGATFGQIHIDFTARTAQLASPTSVTFPTQGWLFSPATGSIQIQGGGAFFRLDSSVTCVGPGCNQASGVGRHAGIFIGPNGDHAGVSIGASAGTSNFNTVRIYCPTC